MSDAQEILHFTVKGMTCGGCAESVKRVIGKIDPEASTTVDLPTGNVKTKTRSDPAAIAAAITKIGFEVQPSQP